MKPFAERLLDWFVSKKRDLPWRRSKNPYHIWVSEIMLQQTRVETVIPYFLRFIERFPTIEALATADEADVLKMWEGLGYYSRARNLQTAVREVQVKYGGQVPASKAEISQLRGVGPYTAGAILSIAFNIAEPAVDGNVLRVMARYFAIFEDIAKAKTRVLIEEKIRPLIPNESAGDFTQALMELGSLVCIPKNPRCEICPVAQSCQAREAGVQAELPIKAKAKSPRVEHRAVAWVESERNGERVIFIRRRASEGLLANMWELPHIEVAGSKEQSLEKDVLNLGEDCRNQYAIELQLKGKLTELEHIFSHIHWYLRVYRFTAITAQQEEIFLTENREDVRWVTVPELNQYTFPLAFSKIIRLGLLL